MKNKIDKYLSIILMAGESTRFGLPKNKVLTKILNKEVYQYSLEQFLADDDCKKIYLVVNENAYHALLNNQDLKSEKINLIIGGKTRLESVQKGLKKALEEGLDYFIIHDAARPLIRKDDIELLKESLVKSDAATLYEPCYDTIRYLDAGKLTQLKRENILKIITPQGFSKNSILEILKADKENPFYTDEISILLGKNFLVDHLKAPHPSPKITTKDDLDYVTYLLNNQNNHLEPNYKIGQSFDFHPFEKGEYLTIGGVKIPFEKKLKGWSDADVLYHAIAESIIGALGLVDLGTLYPDSDERYKGINSSYFLHDLKKKLKELNYQIINIDSIIYLEKPNLKNYKKQMVENIAAELEISLEQVNVKATTMEKKGLVGAGEGIGAEAVTLIRQINNQNSGH